MNSSKAFPTYPFSVSEKHILDEAVIRKGLRSQMIKLTEEMAETITEISKVLNNEAVQLTHTSSEAFDKLAEEIADTEIVLAQVKEKLGINARVEAYRSYKIERLNKRLLSKTL